MMVLFLTFSLNLEKNLDKNLGMLLDALVVSLYVALDPLLYRFLKTNNEEYCCSSLKSSFIQVRSLLPLEDVYCPV